MKQDSLYIVMPAYNEEANIEEVVRMWHPVVQEIGGESRLVILNDGSKDRTGELLKELKKQYPRLIAITKQNEGHGPTVLGGYRYAIHRGADFVFQTDSDGQTLPEEFSRFWERREECGLLIGSRKKRQDGLSRVFVTRVLRLVILLRFGVWVEDANTPFRLMRTSQLQEVLKDIPKHYDLPNVMISVIYKKHGLGITFIPITFRPRQGGVNSINLKRIFRIGRKALSDFGVLRRRI